MTTPRFDDLSFKKMALVINQSVFRRPERNDERRLLYEYRALSCIATLLSFSYFLLNNSCFLSLNLLK